MKRCLAIFAGLVLIAGLASMASAGDPNAFGTKVEDTPHNLMDTVTGPMSSLLADYGEICVYCHTPHNSNVTVEAALWNRTAPTGPYDMYDSDWSSTIDMTVDASPTGVSLACLSCHDGTIGLDVIINPPIESAVTAVDTKITACSSGCHDGTGPGTDNWVGGDLGTDLRNDHPISIEYDPTADTNFKAAADVTAAGLVLYSGKVQCGSCHNPHSEEYRPFLRMSNEGSAMCLACHDI